MLSRTTRNLSRGLILVFLAPCLSIAAAADSAKVGPLLTREAKVTASDAAGGDNFGICVAVSGNTAVVGALLDDNRDFDAGSAYVFVRHGSVWMEQQKLTASDGTQDAGFGTSVALSGDTIVVGAPRDDLAHFSPGSAYVFVRSGNVWSQQQKLTASDRAAIDSFGRSVAISGDTVVIGAPQDDDHGIDSGSAYVFVRTGTVWSQQQKLTSSSGQSDDMFGYSVALSGDTALIGSPAFFHPLTLGSAYVFVRSGSVWSPQQKFTGSDVAPGDDFGSSVALDGDTAVLGAVQSDAAGDRSGSAYVFARDSGVRSQQQKLTAGDAAAQDLFGVSVAVSGDRTVVGSLCDSDAGRCSGSAYLFARSGGIWSQRQKLTASDAAAFDEYGDAVAISGTTVIVGSFNDDSRHPGAGSAYVYRAGADVSVPGQGLGGP